MARRGRERYGVEESVDGEDGEERREELGEVRAAHHARKRKREHRKGEEGRGRRGDGAGTDLSELATSLGHGEIGKDLDWGG